MFGPKPTDPPVFSVGRGQSDQATTTLIARGVKVEGDFSSQGDVAIEGEVVGTLASTGLLTIGVEAKIKADVRANDAVVAGTIEGNVTVVKRLDLKATAKITGDITCESIAIENGAMILGRMSVGRKAEAHAAVSSKRSSTAPNASSAA